MQFCLSKAGIRRFKPLFDRILVEKFLPEVVRHFGTGPVCTHAIIFHFSVVVVQKNSEDAPPPFPRPRGLKIKIANGEGNQIELKAKSATIHAIMHTKLCDSVCLFVFFL